MLPKEATQRRQDCGAKNLAYLVLSDTNIGLTTYNINAGNDPNEI